MTLTVAVTGKSGSGKTTIVKNMLSVFREAFPEKTILLLDNDLQANSVTVSQKISEKPFTVSEAESTSTKQAFPKI